MRLLAACSAVLLAAGFTASASILQDPEILIDSGGDAIPISTGINQVQPDAGCPIVNGMIECSFDFVNDTGNIVTSFIFQMMVHAGLSGQAAASFTCGNPGGFFLGCAVFYDPGTGNLRFTYSGVNPPDNDESFDTEIGEMEGIPPNGHFIITLRGWTPDATSNNEVLYNGLPNLDNHFTTSPEPSAALAIGTGLLLLGALWRRRQRLVR